MLVACIGSRSLPADALAECEWIGRRLVERGHRIVSGNAPGADQAYARGANAVDPAAVILWLPWRAFEAQAIVDGNDVRGATLASPAADLAAALCPNWAGKSIAARQLLTRDVCVVRRAHSVIAWPAGEGAGTRFTMRAARAQVQPVPVVDLSRPGAMARLRAQLDTPTV